MMFRFAPVAAARKRAGAFITAAVALSMSSTAVSAAPVVLYTFDEYDAVASRSVANEGSNGSIGSAAAVGNPDAVIDGARRAVRLTNGNYFSVATPFVPGSNSFSIVIDFALEYGDLDPQTPDRSVLFTLQGGDFAEGLTIQFDGINLNSAVQWGSFSESTLARTETAFPGNDRSWHNLALIGDRGTGELSMFLDGAAVAIGNRLLADSINPTQAMLIGAYRYSSAREGNPEVFTGGPLLIDQVAIYDVPFYPVPAPAAFLLLALGTVGLEILRRRTV